MRRAQLYLACFLLHFLLIVIISVRDVSQLVVQGLTILPPDLNGTFHAADRITSAALGENLGSSNPFHHAVVTYLHLGGIERGYGYFAPNIPSTYRLVFELHHLDGAVEYDLPEVNSASAGLRMAGLLDEIGRTPHDQLREYLLKVLARPLLAQHLDVVMVRAVLGRIVLPEIAEFQAGRRQSYEFVCAYDFRRHREPTESSDPTRK